MVAAGKGVFSYVFPFNTWKLILFEKNRVLQWTKTNKVSNECIWDITFKMCNLSDMNDSHKFQDLWFLCDIIRKRFKMMHKMRAYNLRQCNSTSTLNGYIERDTGKVFIALSTNNDAVEIFEKTLTGGYSCINTRLGFNTEILISNYSLLKLIRWQ